MSEVKDFLGKGVRLRYNRAPNGTILDTLYTTNLVDGWVCWGLAKRHVKLDSPNKAFGLEIASGRCDKAVELFNAVSRLDLDVNASVDAFVAKNGLYGVVKKTHVKDLITYFKNGGPRQPWPGSVTQL